MIELRVVTQAPEAYRALVWDTFFASRGRGLSLDLHFPWLRASEGGTWFVVAQSADSVVGGLCVRPTPDGVSAIASVGLVCVELAHRGQGLSKAMLQRAIDESRDRGLAALRLWTGKPGVYQGLGFVVADPAMFGTVEQPKIHGFQTGVLPRREAWPNSLSANGAGLPPFAASGCRWLTETATLITLEDAEGTIVAEWTGPSEAVAELMEQVLPPQVRINTLKGDDLPAVLTERGWRCNLTESRLQMVLPLLGERTPQEWADQQSPRVLHRI